MSDLNLNLLQAISNWQRGGNAREKHYRGQALKEAVKNLDKKFRCTSLVAFRKVDLKKQPLWQLLAGGKLKETISAWTSTTDVAKTFKGGVPLKAWQGVIVEYLPKPEEVIVNLASLYADSSFKEAIEFHRTNITDYDNGMGEYKGSQNEVVIEKDSLTPSEIYALGGYSNEPYKLGRIFFGRDPEPIEIAWMQVELQRIGKSFGPWWIEGDAKDRVLRHILEEIPALQELKQLQVAKEERRVERLKAVSK